MSDIFISYAREDRERVAPIAKILLSLGWSVWWDPNILSGAEFDEVIARELAAARCVLVVWTAKSVTSNWVRGEAREGLKRGIAVPVLLDPVSPPLDFHAVHATDLTRGMGVADDPMVRQLCDSIARIIDRPPNPPAMRVLTNTRDRKRAQRYRIAFGVLACLITVVVGVNSPRLAPALETVKSASLALVSRQALTAGMAREYVRREAVLRATLSNAFTSYTVGKETDAWAAAQLVTSADPDPSNDRYVFEKVLPNAYDSTCGCWKHIDGGQHAITTAWIILAHIARHHVVADDAIVRVLDLQRADGSWPIYFDAAPNAETSSTYATDYLTLSLHEYVRSGLAKPELANRISIAVSQAGAWLFANRPKSGELWVDYPNAKMQTHSRGLSAVTVYVFLNVFADSRADMILRDWIAGLARPADFDLIESSNQYVVRADGGVRLDGTRFIVFAWEFAALTGGYKRLDWRGRLNAQSFLTEAIYGWNLEPNTLKFKFVVAESAYALRQASFALKPVVTATALPEVH